MSTTPEGQFWWTQAQTVTGFIGVGAIVLTISTLIIERIRRGKSEDTPKLRITFSFADSFLVSRRE
jgi:hypothetical protein